MSSLCFYITENLRKNLKHPQLEALKASCKIASYELKNENSNQEILTPLKDDQNCFILSDAIDFVFFISKCKNHVKSNFILMPGDKDLSIFEKYKEEMKNIRFLIGLVHVDLLKIIILHILTFKSSINQNNIFNAFNNSPVASFTHEVSHSSERAKLQSKVTEFFYGEIQKNKDKLVAGSNSYSKILGDIVDEFLMNAIWDACPSRSHIDRTHAIALNDNEKIELNCLFDGINFILTVSDKFGTFQGEGIAKYIRFGVGYKETDVAKEGSPGAGLGIFMVLQKIGVLIFEVYKGKLTKATVIARGDQSIRDVQKKPKTVLFFER
jgi:hypothetical protein